MYFEDSGKWLFGTLKYRGHNVKLNVRPDKRPPAMAFENMLALFGHLGDEDEGPADDYWGRSEDKRYHQAELWRDLETIGDLFRKMARDLKSMGYKDNKYWPKIERHLKQLD